MLFLLLLLILFVSFSYSQPDDDILPSILLPLEKAKTMFVGSSFASNTRGARIDSVHVDKKKWDRFVEKVVFDAVSLSENLLDSREERIEKGLSDEDGDEIHLKSALDIDENFNRILTSHEYKANNVTRSVILSQTYLEFYESSFSKLRLYSTTSLTSLKLAFPLENFYLAAKFYNEKLHQFFLVDQAEGSFYFEKYCWLALGFSIQMDNLGRLLDDLKFLNAIPVHRSADCVSFLKMYPDIFMEVV